MLDGLLPDLFASRKEKLTLNPSRHKVLGTVHLPQAVVLDCLVNRRQSLEPHDHFVYRWIFHGCHMHVVKSRRDRWKGSTSCVATSRDEPSCPGPTYRDPNIDLVLSKREVSRMAEHRLTLRLSTLGPVLRWLSERRRLCNTGIETMTMGDHVDFAP